MSWGNLFGFSGSKDKNVPILNALEQQRVKQIESLRTFHPSVTEIKKNAKFKITIFIEEKTLSLHVFLPPNFPNELPVVSVSPAITHPWVNKQMVVTGCDALNQFYMHSNLGRALQDVCKELLEHPPTFIQQNNHAASSLSQPYTRPRVYNVESRMKPMMEEVQPSVSTTLVETEIDDDSSTARDSELEGFSKITKTLDNCNIEDLRDLDNNPEKLMKLVFDADMINSSGRNREDQMVKLEKIARENIEKRPKLSEARKRLVDKYDELFQLRSEFDKWSSKQNDLLETRNPHNLQLNLQLGASEMDENAEKVAEQFLDGKLEIEEFIRSFAEKRKLTHIRHWKQENLQRLLIT